MASTYNSQDPEAAEIHSVTTYPTGCMPSERKDCRMEIYLCLQNGEKRAKKNSKDCKRRLAFQALPDGNREFNEKKFFFFLVFINHRNIYSLLNISFLI